MLTKQFGGTVTAVDDVALDIGEGLNQMLRRVKIFERLDRSKIMFIARLLRPRFVLPGEEIVRFGERGNTMYFIATGTVEVRLPDQSIPLGPGEFFGELALLTKKPRTADVAALSYCHLMVLDGRDLRRLLRTDAALKQAIEATAEARLAHNPGGGAKAVTAPEESR